CFGVTGDVSDTNQIIDILTLGGTDYLPLTSPQLCALSLCVVGVLYTVSTRICMALLCRAIQSSVQ
ncbi:unnamed protein product, partial [Staurois parvus]